MLHVLSFPIRHSSGMRPSFLNLSNKAPLTEHALENNIIGYTCIPCIEVHNTSSHIFSLQSLE